MIATDRSEPPWRYLDPGIRAAVRVLWDAGFATTDSGDGASKPAAGRVFDFPHVAVMLTGDADLRAECRRALALDYSACGLEPPTPTVCEVSFSALDGKAVLFVGWPGEEGSTPDGDGHDSGAHGGGAGSSAGADGDDVRGADPDGDEEG